MFAQRHGNRPAHVVHVDLLSRSRLGESLVGRDVELVTSVDGHLTTRSALCLNRKDQVQLTSASSFIKPVLISGPLVSRAMAMGRPPYFSAAARVLSTTDW